MKPGPEWVRVNGEKFFAVEAVFDKQVFAKLQGAEIRPLACKP